MLNSNELELSTKLSLGTLESNAETIRDVVNSKLEDYKPENYVGKIEEAKADRAVLNEVASKLNKKRLELEREYMIPFEKFKAIIKETCDSIKIASSKLDEIVKAEEEREKLEKKCEIMEYWNSTEFSLFGIEKVFDKKWLNKTAKFKDICKEIDAIQQKTFEELKILENFPAEDVPLLKTVYLETLSITEAMHKADLLKQNREKLRQEAIARAAVEKNKNIKNQKKEEARDIYKAERSDAMSDLASSALGLDIEQEQPEELEEYALVLKGKRNQLLAVRAYMTDHGLTYSKLTDNGNGVYTLTKE